MKILITESRDYNPEALATYSKYGDLIAIDGNTEEIFAHLPSVEVIVVRIKHYLDQRFFEAGKQLRYIVTPTTGLTHIDQKCASAHSVQIFSLKEDAKFLKTVTATAELTWSLLLNLTRRTVAATQHVAEGGWDRDKFRGTDLNGKTIGVVGYGRLGRQVASYASAFGMQVLVYDPYVTDYFDGVEPTTLDHLLRSSHVVSVHVALTSETELMFTEREFSLMKPGVILINTARGEVFCESAFVDARRAGIISAAGLDVLAKERGIDGAWLARSPIAQLAQEDPNIIITPHIGGCTLESMHKTELWMAHKLAGVIEAS